MRVIKFRVWCENKMEPVGAIDWACGLPITCNTKTRKLYQDDDHFTLMQYTGMKDSRGKEIYEGDIVKLVKGNDVGYHGDFLFGDSGYVHWYERYAEFCISFGEEFDNNIGNFVRDGSFNVLEVIGNIYEKAD